MRALLQIEKGVVIWTCQMIKAKKGDQKNPKMSVNGNVSIMLQQEWMDGPRKHPLITLPF